MSLPLPRLFRTLVLSAAVAAPFLARADLLKNMAEKRKDSVKEFDLSADPAALAPTFVEGRKLTALKGVQRIIIPNFQVEFAIENSASASGGGTNGVASVKSRVALLGIEGPVFQKIAEQIFDMVKAKGQRVDYSAFGGANSEKVAYVLKTTPETYARAVAAHLNAAHAMFLSVVKASL